MSSAHVSKEGEMPALAASNKGENSPLEELHHEGLQPDMVPDCVMYWRAQDVPGYKPLLAGQTISIELSSSRRMTHQSYDNYIMQDTRTSPPGINISLPTERVIGTSLQPSMITEPQSQRLPYAIVPCMASLPSYLLGSKDASAVPVLSPQSSSIRREVPRSQRNSIARIFEGKILSYYWKNGAELRVRFLNGEKDIQDKIMKYAEVWTNHANIRFKRVDGNTESHIRIKTNSKYSKCVLGASALDVNQEQPTMWLRVNKGTHNSLFRRDVLHEFGHALGCIHEHQSPNSTIQWDNKALLNKYCRQGELQKQDWISVELDFFALLGAKALTPFDEKSIMSYEIPAGLTTDGYHSGGLLPTELSKLDKLAIAKIYPKKNQSTQKAKTAEYRRKGRTRAVSQ